MKPKRTLFRKLLIIFILIGIIPPLVLTLLGFTFSSKILQDAIYDEAYDSLININKNIDTFLNEYKTIVNMISKDSKLHKTLSGNEISDDYYYEINQKIYLLLASKKYKFPIYILDTKGNPVFETSPLPQMYKNNLQNGWGVFRKMNEQNEIVLYPEKFINNMGETIVFSMGKKIYDNNNNPVGYVIIDIKRNAIVDIINTIGNSKLLDVMLLDEFYYIITDANHPEKEGFFLDLPYRDTVATVPLNIIQENNSNIRKTIIQSFIISISLAVFISLIVANYMIRPIKKLVKSMKKVEEGDLTVQINLHRNDELGMLENSFNQMVLRLKESIDSAIDKQRRLRIAEINILQAQIKPHFLYNTLDAIKWIAKLNNVKEISVIATQLGSLLRNSINCEQEFLTVKDNLDLINNYLEIQKIRYNDGFDVNIYTDNEILGYYIPKLILQPIVENAIVHGFENIDEKGTLIIRCYKKDYQLYFEVLDNGIGMNKKQLEKALCKKSDDHIGLYNVDQRVKLYYGDLSGITIKSNSDTGTKVIIKIPIKAYYKEKY
ncbi:two-component system sensor histidine kinase YesM [Vallitalea sediminicola]